MAQQTRLGSSGFPRPPQTFLAKSQQVIVTGPFTIEAAGMYVAGAERSVVSVAGADAAGMYVAGAEKAKFV